MDTTGLKLESLKMVREWTTWLVAIQVAICGFLWDPIRKSPQIATDSLNGWQFIVLYTAWAFFVLSILTAGFLLLRLPVMVEALAKSGESDESVQALKAPLASSQVRLKTLIFAQYLLFFLGAVLTGIFLLFAPPSK